MRSYTRSVFRMFDGKYCNWSLVKATFQRGDLMISTSAQMNFF